MKSLKHIASWLWRLAVAGAIYGVGLVLGGGLAAALRLEPPRIPEPADPTIALLLLLSGGMAIALGLAAMASGLEGRSWQRWAILGAFAFVVNGVGTAIETTHFTTLGGDTFAALATLPASFLCSLAVVMLFPGLPRSSATVGVRAGFASFGTGKLAARLLLALLAFPFFYFLFGLMIAPIVIPYTEQLDFLVIPPMSMLLRVLLLRSALFLLVSVPVIACWGRSRGRLAVALGVGHFTAVGLSGLLQVTFFPAVMRWTHGVEILATSACYGLALAWLLFAPSTTPPAAGRVAERQAAER
jgi:hypothetical protein